MRKLFYCLVVSAAMVLLLYAVRIPILRGAGNFLSKIDNPQRADVMFVLSGNAYDRGMHAAKLYQQGLVTKIICTGENLDRNALVLGRDYPEADLTRKAVMLGGVDSAKVEVLREGTSTFEESDAILEYCKTNNIQRCIVVTSLFHTRRVSWIIKDKLEEAGVQTFVSGAPPRTYNAENWWQSEYGLIDLNNEYVKLVYYLLKY